MGFLSESVEFTGRRVWVLPSSYRTNWIELEVNKGHSDLSCTRRDIVETVGTLVGVYYMNCKYDFNK